VASTAARKTLTCVSPGAEGKLGCVQSLRDKLVKAGLVTEQQAREADRKPQTKRPGSEPEPAPLPDAPGSAGKPAAEDSHNSRAEQRRESQRQLELDRNLLELVLRSQVVQESGQRAFYFMTRKGKARRWELSEAQAKLLEEGKLAIVERRESGGIEHSLVPSPIADTMAELAPASVRFYNRGGLPADPTRG